MRNNKTDRRRLDYDARCWECRQRGYTCVDCVQGRNIEDRRKPTTDIIAANDNETAEQLDEMTLEALLRHPEPEAQRLEKAIERIEDDLTESYRYKAEESARDEKTFARIEFERNEMDYGSELYYRARY